MLSIFSCVLLAMCISFLEKCLFRSFTPPPTFVFCLFRTIPAAYGGSKARGLIGAVLSHQYLLLSFFVCIISTGCLVVVVSLAFLIIKMWNTFLSAYLTIHMFCSLMSFSLLKIGLGIPVVAQQ